MNNKVYTESNGVVMVESVPYNWVRGSVYEGVSDYYSIYTGGMGGGYNCIYQNGILSMIGDDTLRFEVDSIEDAGRIVQKFVNAMGIDLSDTIYLGPELNLNF